MAGNALASLIVTLGLDAAQFMGGLARSESDAKRTVDSIERNTNKVNAAVGNTARNVQTLATSVKGVLAGLGVGLGLGELISFTDQYTKFTAQLKLATSSQAEYARALSDVKSIAAAAQADLNGVGVLYARIANGTRELGLSQKQVSEITETVSLSLKASGATAAESASAMLQLAQAFGSGVLRGQEFNAVNEAAPRLMRALAEGIGVPVGQLRAMAEAGKLTSDVMARALPRALSELRKEAEQVQTISGAFTVLKNNVMEFIGTQAQANGSVRVVTSAITALAENLGTLSAVLTGLTVLKVSQWIVGIAVALNAKTTALASSVVAIQAERAATVAATTAEIARAESTLAFIAVDRARAISQLQSAQSTIAATAAMGAQSAALAANTAAAAGASIAMAELAALGRLQASASAQLTAAQAALNTAMAGGGLAATGLSRVLGFLGGPIGAITTALSLGATAWVLWGNKSDESAKKAAATLESTTPEILANLEKQNQKLRERIALASAGQPEAARAGGEGAERLAGILRQINELRAKGDALSNVEKIDLIELTGKYNDLAKSLAINVGLTKEVQAIGQQRKAGEWMDQYATKAEQLAKELKKAREELGDAFTPEIERRIRDKFADKGAIKHMEDLRQLYTEVANIGRTIDVPILPLNRIVDLSQPFEKNKQVLEDLRKTLQDGTKGWIVYAEAVLANSDAELTAAGTGKSFQQTSEEITARVLALIDPLYELKKANDEITRSFADGSLRISEEQLAMAKLHPEVRALLQAESNIFDKIQRDFEAGNLSVEKMQAAVLRANQPLEKTNDIAQRLGMTFESSFESLIFGAREGVKASKLLESALVDVLKVLFRIQVTEPLAQGIKDSGGGFFKAILSGLGLGGSGAVNSAGIGSGGQGAATVAETLAFWGHSGAIVGQEGVPGYIDSAVFGGAKRLHTGGLAGDEVPIIAKRDEGIFTPGQMRALAPAKDRGNVIYISPKIHIDSRTDAAFVRQEVNRGMSQAIAAIPDQVRRGGAYRKVLRG